MSSFAEMDNTITEMRSKKVRSMMWCCTFPLQTRNERLAMIPKKKQLSLRSWVNIIKQLLSKKLFDYDLLASINYTMINIYIQVAYYKCIGDEFVFFYT